MSPYTGLSEGLDHLKIETKVINERFASVMGECVILTTQTLRQYTTGWIVVSKWYAGCTQNTKGEDRGSLFVRLFKTG